MIQTILNKGNLIVFPEGTRNKTNELLLPFRYGAVRVAQITNAPIIPVVIEKVKSKKYKVRIGEKIIINQSDDIKESNDKLHNIMKEMLIDLKNNLLKFRRKIYEYDSDGNMIKSSYYKADGMLNHIREYDKEGNRIN